MNNIRIFTLLFCLFSTGIILRAQNTDENSEGDGIHTHEIDSAMAISPLYLPTSYTALGTTFFKPVKYRDIDTTLDLAGQYDPLIRTQNCYQTLGIHGQAHKAMNFGFENGPGFSLISNPYPLYFKTQNDLQYYKLKTSYTQLAFSYGIATENTFTATHAQNIRDWAEVVVNLRGYGNTGYFTHQQTNNVVADVLCHFEIPSEIYGFRLSYIVNHFKMEENGGLASTEDFLTHAINKLQGYNMRLYDAKSHVLTHDLMFQQYVNIKSKKKNSDSGEMNHWGTFTHTFQFKQQSYRFNDNPVDSAYYPHVYSLPTDTIHDTMTFFSIANTLQFSTFQPYKEPKSQRYFFHFTGGITHEYTRYQSAFYSGNAFIPFAQAHIRLFTYLDLHAKIYYTLGSAPHQQERSLYSGCYQKNDMNFSASVTARLDAKGLHSVGADFDLYRLSPEYIFTALSNGICYWNNSWPKQTIISFTPHYQYQDYRVEFSYYMLHNYVYLNEELTPALLDSYANVLQLHLYAPFRYKGFGVTFNGYLQYSTHQAIAVPLFAGKLDFFYHMNIFKNKAKLQVGFNAAYNTSYYADAYYPLLHQFYHQREVKTGNYCYLDLYLAIQVQRINIFLKGSHLLSGLMGYQYFTTPGYPMQDRRFSLGISWRFHD